ncbi:MAG: SPFH domain-containing protein [Planctomycetota bacterium]
MTAILLVFGLVIAGGILALIPKVKSSALRASIATAAIIVLGVFFVLGSFRFVPEDRIGVVIKNVGGKGLPPGKIIATEGEKGPQADILPPGWHPFLWPFIFDVEFHPIVRVETGSVGLVTARDGLPLPADSIYAPEWAESDTKRMAQDAGYFLGDGGGYKGPQTSVLRPGSYRINPKLFDVELVRLTNIERATVGVVKSNVGATPPAISDDGLVGPDERGIRRQPLEPKEYYLNSKALEVTVISTAKRVLEFTKAQRTEAESEITVRSSDGFTFPVDVRVEYEIKPIDAPLVVATFRDDGELLQDRLISAVRSVFRNNAEGVKALDYVQQRSSQEAQSLSMLQMRLAPLGVTVTGVAIGDVGDRETLGELLQTQTDREIALQEQITFQEQQRAAEQRKQLTRTEQEAEEERRLATARYEVQIAEEDKRKRIIAAEAEAEAIRVRAEAQAAAFQAIAREIGPGNAALIEVLQVIGERGINIAPRVMVNGGGADESDSATTALIGTMLDSMIDRDPQPSQRTP